MSTDSPVAHNVADELNAAPESADNGIDIYDMVERIKTEDSVSKLK